MTLRGMAGAFAAALIGTAAVFSVAILPAATFAQEPAGAGATRPAQIKEKAPESAPKGSATDPAASAAKSPLSRFEWLTGRWQGQWGPRVAQEVWLAPRSGTMVGALQITEDGKTLVVELYTILSTSQGVELRVRHFTPSLVPWPVERSGASVLKLVGIDPKSILFENQGNGQPKHWLMKRTGPDTYVARFEIVPEKGEAQTVEITYHRETSAAPANRKH